jgi:CubicO group peptidase (beta-lactamase class C family)
MPKININHIIPRAFLFLFLIGAVAFAAAGPVFSKPASTPDFAAIDAYLQEEMKRHRIPGMALAITHQDEIVHLRGFGTAGEGQDITPQTPFFIGSLSKSFTALGVMQLVEAGEIELDDPVQSYLPWFQVADEQASAAITVRQLLNQTGGLSSMGHKRGALSSETTLEDTVRGLKEAALTAPVGETYQYFNLNYNILGLIIEEVSGQSYEEYLREQIFTPLDMAHSFVSKSEAQQAGLANGHNVFFGFPVEREQPFLAYDLPAGFVISSAEDMAHYLIAHTQSGRYLDARVLSPEGMETLLQPVDQEKKPYAMGWIVQDRHETQMIHHNGAVRTFYAYMAMLPEEGYGVTLLINQNSLPHLLLANESISAGVVDLLLGYEPGGGISMRLLYGLFAAFVVFDLGRHAFLIRNIVRSNTPLRKRKIILKYLLPFIMIVVLLLLLIYLNGWEATRLLLVNYAPDLGLWLLFGGILSLLEAILSVRKNRRLDHQMEQRLTQSAIGTDRDR